MKRILLLFSLTFLLSLCVYSDTWVDGYYRADGTYVEGHWRSDRNGTANDNWSSDGNYNPWTGKKGNKNTDYNPFN